MYGRIIIAGSLGMGAYRAYQQYRGRDAVTVQGRSHFGEPPARSHGRRR